MKKIVMFGVLICVFVLGFSLIGTAENKSSVLVMKIGSSQAIINGEYVVIDEFNPSASPVIIEEKTYVPIQFMQNNFDTAIDVSKVKTTTVWDTTFVPLRDLAESMGYNVYFKDGVIVINSDKNAAAPPNSAISEYNKKLFGLPKVGSKAKLEQLLSSLFAEKESNIKYYSSSAATGAAPAPSAAPQMAAAEAGTAANDSARSSADFSATNTQVKGVDEGDIIKTDGEYIYFSPGNGDYVSIIKATPANEMSEASRINLDGFSINEMYLGENQLIAIASGYKELLHGLTGIEPYAMPSVQPRDMAYIYPSYYGGTTITKVFVFNIADIKNPKQAKTFEIDGYINSSRKLGNELYLITASYVAKNGDNIVLPTYKDSVSGKEKPLDLATMCYLPEVLSQSVTTITGIKLDALGTEAVNTSYLGNCGTIYMSTENLYITTASYNYRVDRPYSSTSRTNIYKFGLDRANATFSARGSVDGNLLNQFSMDEHKGYFRIATTTWTSNGHRSNNMFVLDKTLNLTGRITDIAPNENIYSVRFLGDKAHMVTFEVVDPLFVIDLSNPQKPAVLGELKIPGYSVYLHPYDENHLIGFGYDTVEVDGSASMRGLKLSMFDVSDLKNPKEKFTTIIGDRGTSSELLYNHKTLLFSKEKNLLAFPIEVRTLTSAEQKDRWAYGKFAFQGAYVYEIDMAKGFVLSGTITNSDSGIEGDYNNYVQRVLYIGDALYTASNNSIVSTDMKTFNRLGKASVN